MYDLKTSKRRSSIYDFLSLVFLKEPDVELVETLNKISLSGFFDDSNLDLGIDNEPEKNEKILEKLVLDYTRLFIGPGMHISPYESVYIEGEGVLWGESTAKVKRLIEKFGLEYSPDWKGLPDHVGIELELMKKLIEHEQDALKKKDENDLNLCMSSEKKLLDEHLLKWIPLFCDKIIAEMTDKFYGKIAEITKNFIKFDRKNIDLYCNNL